MEKMYVNQEGQVLIIKKEECPINPIANFVEFCPLHCREDGNIFFISDRFEMMHCEPPKDTKDLQIVFFAEISGKLQAVKSLEKLKEEVLGFAFTTEKMDKDEFIDLVNEDLSVFQEYLYGKVYNARFTDINECEEDVLDNVYDDGSFSFTGENPLMKFIKKKNGKCLYKSQLDDDYARYERLWWVETRRDKNGYILSWEDVLEEKEEI